jgi:hypothetical protein
MELRTTSNTEENSNTVSYLRYVEINVFSTQYRLINLGNNKLSFTINGIIATGSFLNDNSTGIQIYVSGSSLVFSASFGLSVVWTGDNAEINLCSAYSNKVCGVCGNADSNLSILLILK